MEIYFRVVLPQLSNSDLFILFLLLLLLSYLNRLLLINLKLFILQLFGRQLMIRNTYKVKFSVLPFFLN